MRFQNSGPLAVTKLAPRLQKQFRLLFAAGTPRIHDYGCGYGGWIKYIMSINPRTRYRATDIDQDALSYTRGLFPANCDEEMSQFDVVMAFGLFELIPVEEQERLLDEFRNMLAPGGTLLLQYNVYNPFSIRWILLSLVSFGHAKRFHLERKYFRTFLTIPQIDSMFLRHGYDIIACETDKLSHFLPSGLDRALRLVFRSRHFYSTLYYFLAHDVQHRRLENVSQA